MGTWTADGVWPAQPTTHADFRTRLLVRRPVDPAAFNGTVVVEWDNVSAGFDTGPTWTAAIDELLRRGYAYVGVSAQKVGVEQMKASNVARYGTLTTRGTPTRTTSSPRRRVRSVASPARCCSRGSRCRSSSRSGSPRARRGW